MPFNGPRSWLPMLKMVNLDVAMGQNPVPPANIPSPTKIGSKMGGASTPNWDPIGFDNHSHVDSERNTTRVRGPRPIRSPALLLELPPEVCAQALQTILAIFGMARPGAPQKEACCFPRG